MTTAFLIGRIIFGLYFVMFGYMHLKDRKMLTDYAKSKRIPAAGLAVVITGLLMLLGGLGVIFQQYVYISLIFLLVFLIPVSFTMHQFWKETDPQRKMSEMVNFTKNMALIGAILMMFSL